MEKYTNLTLRMLGKGGSEIRKYVMMVDLYLQLPPYASSDLLI